MIGRYTALGLQTAQLYVNDSSDADRSAASAKQTLEGVYDIRSEYPVLLVRPGEVALLPKNRFLQSTLKGRVQHGSVEQDIVADPIFRGRRDTRAPGPNELLVARGWCGRPGNAGTYLETISN